MVLEVVEAEVVAALVPGPERETLSAQAVVVAAAAAEATVVTTAMAAVAVEAA